MLRAFTKTDKLPTNVPLITFYMPVRTAGGHSLAAGAPAHRSLLRDCVRRRFLRSAMHARIKYVGKSQSCMLSLGIVMEFVEGLALSDRIGAALESAVPIPEPEIWRIVVRFCSMHAARIRSVSGILPDMRLWLSRRCM